MDENRIFAPEGTEKQKYRKDLPLKSAKTHPILLYHNYLTRKILCQGLRARENNIR